MIFLSLVSVACTIHCNILVKSTMLSNNINYNKLDEQKKFLKTISMHPFAVIITASNSLFHATALMR